MISSKIVEVPVVGEAGDRRADAHDRRADRRRPRTRARASCANASSPAFVDEVGAEARALVHGRVGRDEHDVAGRAVGRGAAATTRRVSRIGPSRFVSTMRRWSSSVISWIAARAARCPALLTSTWIAPASRVATCRAERVDRLGVGARRARARTAVPPASATSSRGLVELIATRRAPSATDQPSSPSATAIARPMPGRRTRDDRDARRAGGASAKEFTAVDVERLTGDDASTTARRRTRRCSRCRPAAG